MPESPHLHRTGRPPPHGNARPYTRYHNIPYQLLPDITPMHWHVLASSCVGINHINGADRAETPALHCIALHVVMVTPRCRRGEERRGTCWQSTTVQYATVLVAARAGPPRSVSLGLGGVVVRTVPWWPACMVVGLHSRAPAHASPQPQGKARSPGSACVQLRQSMVR